MTDNMANDCCSDLTKKISAFEEGTLFANQVYQYVQCLHPI